MKTTKQNKAILVTAQWAAPAANIQNADPFTGP
jgi:hypothetical protein